MSKARPSDPGLTDVEKDEFGILRSSCCQASLPVETRAGRVVAVCEECGAAVGPAEMLLDFDESS